ncbi:hypothetical protein N8J89_23720 [Crossiella sp. CA-258035]|uniref:hypothetical protein n=1 Tax=Crossiella sp. CA-258035 TaxID=2981138 RepID=UPI0024BC9210|nr:hypothetical protein [Crossiella sp. CA-258035]WHT16140.1 hypothetical protein N8J89_23720 [Crossiella sp. CA-258035]
MRKIRSAGITLMAAAAALASAGTATAATPGLDDTGSLLNNVSVLPVQLCNSHIDVIGLTVPIGTEYQTDECINAPVGNDEQVLSSLDTTVVQDPEKLADQLGK